MWATRSGLVGAHEIDSRFKLEFNRSEGRVRRIGIIIGGIEGIEIGEDDSIIVLNVPLQAKAMVGVKTNVTPFQEFPLSNSYSDLCL